jgi:hypothetical protein
VEVGEWRSEMLELESGVRVLVVGGGSGLVEGIFGNFVLFEVRLDGFQVG